MRRIVTAVAVILLASSTTFADRIGLLAGYRSNNISGFSSGTSTNATGGYQAGLLYYWTLLDVLSLRTGGLYTIRDVGGTSGGANFTVHASYVDIPINLQLNIPAIGLYFFGGVRYGFLSSSSCDSCNLPMNSTDLVANIGPGYELVDFGVGSLAIEGQYESGLTNVNSSGSNNVTTNGWALSMVLNIGI